MQRFRPNPAEVVDLTADDDDDGPKADKKQPMARVKHNYLKNEAVRGGFRVMLNFKTFGMLMKLRDKRQEAEFTAENPECMITEAGKQVGSLTYPPQDLKEKWEL
ncbi:Carbonic Anhydrase 7 [Manis pentadactyla]|nr:Carbonic Anhydrase 7 [Manis pentadactyla]